MQQFRNLDNGNKLVFRRESHNSLRCHDSTTDTVIKRSKIRIPATKLVG